ncbi:DUF3127 domain-containing protein [Paludibacteraceae bacterium OttesenSCG-928-F17]|nr:DUF3127 domain-containing protein [Paludibacteraceae bacterium OttesenSCG-928-F17]
MEITGKIIAVLPLATGEGKNGTWRSQDYVLETFDQYPKKVCFNLFNDRIDQFKMAIGDTVDVSFDIESREYNGRWYTTVRAWRVNKKTQDAPMVDSAAGQFPPFDPSSFAETGDDLPF